MDYKTLKVGEVPVTPKSNDWKARVENYGVFYQ
jgi:hypothetical protein